MSDTKQVNAEFDARKFAEIELGKLLDSLNSLNNLRVQLGGAFAAAIFLLVTSALKDQKVSLFFVGASLLLTFIYLDSTIRSSMAAFYFRGLQIRSRYLIKDKDAFLGTYISLQTKMVADIQELSNIKDIRKRNRLLRNIGFRHPSFAGFWIPLGGCIAEIIAGLFLLLKGWQWF